MKYYVNKGAGTVVCVMNDVDAIRCEAINYIAGKLDKCETGVGGYAWETPFADIAAPFVYRYMKKRYTGKAKCASTDVFNEETGKEVARARCLAQYYKDLSEAAHEMSKFMYNITLRCQCKSADASASEEHWYKIINDYKKPF